MQSVHAAEPEATPLPRLQIVSTRNPDLVKLETHITKAATAFVDAGIALAEIRKEKLYEKDGFQTFEEYCSARWNFTKRRANQLIAAADVAYRLDLDRIRGNICSPPHNEAQARELAKLPEAQQSEAWTEVIRTAPNGNVTAKHVRSIVAARLPPKEPPTFHPLVALGALRGRVEKSLDSWPEASRGVVANMLRDLADEIDRDTERAEAAE